MLIVSTWHPDGPSATLYRKLRTPKCCSGHSFFLCVEWVWYFLELGLGLRLRPGCLRSPKSGSSHFFSLVWILKTGATWTEALAPFRPDLRSPKSGSSHRFPSCTSYSPDGELGRGE